MRKLFTNTTLRLPVCLVLCIVCFITSANAQGGNEVKGQVKDEAGKPVANVSVIAKNHSTNFTSGAQTDSLGLFQFLNLPLGGPYSFTISAIGYESQYLPGYTIKEKADVSLLVKLISNTRTLDQVVVVGYGTQQKRFVTGSVTKVSGEQLSAYSSPGFAQQLAGKAAGIQVNEASGQPGSNPQIIVRGIGTLTAGRNPLVVVDGFPLTEGTSFNYINPNDIESLEVLKDPASAAVYGSRAANGVILITTKKGKSDKLVLNVDAYTGFQEKADKVEYVDAYDAAVYLTEARDWGYVSKNPANRSVTDDRATRIAKGASLRELPLHYLAPYLNKDAGLVSTDWINEIFRKAPMTNINAALSGGNGKTFFYTSFNYFNQEGLLINNGLKRYSASVKINSKINERAEFGISLNPSYTTQRFFNTNGGFDEPIGAVTAMYPFFKPYNDDGSLAISEQIKANTAEDGALVENPVAMINMIKNNRTFFRVFGNAFASYTLLKGLKYKFTIGGDFGQSTFDFYNPSSLGAYRTPAPKPASAAETNASLTNYLLEHTLTYARTLGRHDFNVVGGYSYQKENSSSTAVTGANIADDNVDNIGGASTFTASPSRERWVQLSWLARVQYIFDEKYITSLTYRTDGSSRFGANNRWGKFPSVTAGWIFSKENFFPQQQVVTFGKLRGTWGRSGNNQIGSYGSLALVTGGNAANNYVWGNASASGFAASATPNPNLSWETNTSYNLGVDLQLFGKIDVTAEYYQATTSNLLLDVPVPQQSGFSNSLQNIGKIRNTGVELSISSSAINLGPIQWIPNANISTNQNTVLTLAPGQTQIISGTNNNIITRVGRPVAEFYGYQVMGVFKTQADLDRYPKLPGTLMGDLIVKDENGDGIIDNKDWIPMGTYSPKFTYGFSSVLNYRNLQLSFSLTGVEGRKVMETNFASREESGEGFSMPTKYYFENRYHPVNNPNGFLGQPNYGNFSAARRSTRASDLYIFDADYLRLRDVQLAYIVPAKLLKRAGVTSVKVYVSANNLFTSTSFRGYNPEATTSSVLTNGQSNSNYPVARSFLVGCHIIL